MDNDRKVLISRKAISFANRSLNKEWTEEELTTYANVILGFVRGD